MLEANTRRKGISSVLLWNLGGILSQFLCFLSPHQGWQKKGNNVVSMSGPRKTRQTCPSACGASQVQHLQGKLASQCFRCVHPPTCPCPCQLSLGAWAPLPCSGKCICVGSCHCRPEDGAAAETMHCSAQHLTSRRWRSETKPKLPLLHLSWSPKLSPTPTRLWATKQVNYSAVKVTDDT